MLHRNHFASSLLPPLPLAAVCPGLGSVRYTCASCGSPQLCFLTKSQRPQTLETGFPFHPHGGVSGWSKCKALYNGRETRRIKCLHQTNKTERINKSSSRRSFMQWVLRNKSNHGSDRKRRGGRGALPSSGTGIRQMVALPASPCPWHCLCEPSNTLCNHFPPLLGSEILHLSKFTR